ncbi:MAG: efflux RND transporter periplasmic adaptor subunit [Acidobacteriia bacterium]|nr:efflux RND transporter periplasmic adaptor subunit [Terriglobia bacterium]MBZ5701185.1 efflux RND transporter periplasmic adaptor subunit [Terriglobia bacterium]
MERKLRNRILLFLLLAGVIAYVLVWMSGRQPAAKIAAVLPARENLVASISSNGKVEPIAPFVMRAQLATFVDKVYALEGQSLHKGQPILELDVKDAAAQLAQARASLLRAQDDLRAARAGGRSDDIARVTGDLVRAQAERDRLLRDNEALKRLVAQQAATKDELAANEVALARAQSEYNRLAAVKQEFARQVLLDAQRAALQVEQARSEVAALEEKVRESRVVAPADGTLYSLPVRTGDFVKVGDLLGEMANLRQVRVRAFIDEPELGSLAPDEPVTITWDALPSRSWQGRTTVIPKQVVARGTRSVGELLCAVNNDKLELLPNTNVNVLINAKERQHVLAVPRGAVELEGGQRYVFVVKDNDLGVGKKHLEKRQVQVGIASPTSYEITGGLQEGEYVALPSDVDLKDGMAVRVVNLE